MKARTRRAVLGAAGLVSAVALYLLWSNVCLSTWWRTRLVLPQCPDGALRQVALLEARDLRRGAPGTVFVGARAHYTTRDAEHGETVAVTSFTTTLALVDAAGKETPLEPSKPGWQGSPGEFRRAQVALPEVSDGDYELRARIVSRLGESAVDVPLALYAPARVHVVTDRPLYEPGNLVKFRAVVLRARDLVPLDGRPGRWM